MYFWGGGKDNRCTQGDTTALRLNLAKTGKLRKPQKVRLNKFNRYIEHN